MLLIKTERNNLLKPLQMVTGIVEKKQTMPILANVVIEKQQERMTFLASDKEMQITATTQFDTNEGENFSITVSAQKFQDILRALDGETQVSLIREDEKLIIKSPNNRFNLHILPSTDFPRMSEDDNCLCAITIPQLTLKTLLSRVQYAIADQDLRYYLNGVLLTINSNELKAVGTDTHRLALAKTDIERDDDTTQDAILPRKTVLELLKLLKEDEDSVKIEFLPKKIRFSFLNIVFISKLIDGKYINYNRAIPTQNEKQLQLNRLDFLQALQRVAILSNSNELFRGARLLIEKNNLRIVSKNTDQEEAVEEMPIDYDDTPIDICLKLPHLLDLLNHVNVEKFHFALANESDSVLITIPEKSEFSYVVMPIKI